MISEKERLLVQMTVKETLRSVNLLPSTISRTEIVKEIGRAAYDKAVKRGLLVPIDLGTKKNMFKMEEYEKFLNNEYYANKN